MNYFQAARRVNSANRRETLISFLKKTFLFAGFDDYFLGAIVDNYSEKMAIWWNSNEAKNCQLPSNDMVTFIIQGKFYAIIANEFDAELIAEVESENLRAQPDKKLILETLTIGKHFGDALPPLGIFDDYDDTNFTISYYAQSYEERLVCLQIEDEAFQDLINENPMLSSRLLNIYKERLKFTTEKMRQFSQLNNYQRLRNHLYEIADETENGYVIDFSQLTQQVIADTIGCNRTTVTKELKTLENGKHLIKQHRKVFHFESLPLANGKFSGN